MAGDLNQVVQLLDATLKPAERRKAELALKAEEKHQGFSLLLLQIVHNESLPQQNRLSAALYFKNFIRFNYVDAQGNYKLPSNEVDTIKQELIGLMITCPPAIQTQLGEAISLIADSDFWERWQTLVTDLVSRLTPDNAKVNNGVLEVAHSIFQRWRPLYRSDELFTEINHVLKTFAAPFLELMIATDGQIKANQNNKEALKAYLLTFNLLIKVFYDLSCQDLPPQFEESLDRIAALLHEYLVYQNNLLVTDDDDEASVLENVKADICDVLQLYTTKYDDEFGRFAPKFISSAWNLLSSLGPQQKYDNLVSKALQFLTAIASQDSHAQNFNDEAVLKQIVEGVVLPNVALRESDIEQFEDEPIEFIRRDLEGSDTDSRRRAATDFLKKLQEKFEALVTGVAGNYINHYLEQGKTNWKDKDTAVSLFFSIAAKGAVTAAQGVKTINSLIDVVDFFQKHIAADLINVESEPISKVDAIKFLYTFRSQLTKEQWQGAFQPLIQNLGSDNYVVYTYAAIAVERVLYLTDDAGNHVFSRTDIEPFAKDLLDHLFKLVEKDTAPAKMQENEFLMRCIMRVLIVMKDGVLPFADMVLDHLIRITAVIKENPSNPRFYYYHFEALGALVKNGSPGASAQLQERLWAPLHTILIEEVNEFIPYVFQLFAALLEPNPSGALPDHYKALVGPLILPTIWETRGNVPGAARLLAAIIPRATESIIAENQLEPILGIFQKLLSGKKTEQSAFEILDVIVVSIPKPVLEKYFVTILQLLYTKLQNNPSDSYKRNFVCFYHLVSAKTEAGLGADFFIAQTDSIQANIFTPIYLQQILPISKTLARPVDRKLAVVSFAKSLAESQAFAQRYQKGGWRFTCEAMLTLLANAPTLATGGGNEVVNEADVDDIGFGMGFTPLNTCRQPTRDEFPQIQDVPQWVKQYLTHANASQNNVIAGYVQERLTDEGKQALAVYIS